MVESCFFYSDVRSGFLSFLRTRSDATCGAIYSWKFVPCWLAWYCNLVAVLLFCDVLKWGLWGYRDCGLVVVAVVVELQSTLYERHSILNWETNELLQEDSPLIPNTSRSTTYTQCQDIQLSTIPFYGVDDRSNQCHLDPHKRSSNSVKCHMYLKVCELDRVQPNHST